MLQYFRQEKPGICWTEISNVDETGYTISSQKQIKQLTLIRQRDIIFKEIIFVIDVLVNEII